MKYLAVFLLSACSAVQVAQVPGPNGHVGYKLSCNND